MHVYNAALRRFLPAVLALVAPRASAQNLFANPGFDRDLGGWLTVSTPVPSPPEAGLATVGWSASDASGSSLSGGIALHAVSRYPNPSVSASAGQCFAVTPGSLATVSARILTTRQYLLARTSVWLNFFSSADCSGSALARSYADSLPFGYPPVDSGGRWIFTTTKALASSAARSVLAEISATASAARAYPSAEVEAVADDAILTLTPGSTTTWILPSSGWIHGAAESYWRTTFTLVNPGPDEASVTLKWLGHDVDGRGGHEFTYLISAGQTLAPDVGTWELNFPEDWGAILVTSTSSALILQSETSTRFSGGSVGQALPALGPNDYASAAPKTLAPIRQNGLYRTNLVLANPTELPETVRVVLYDADGWLVGTRDVGLPPLGMTQINGVAAALGAPSLGLGRLAVSTPTPGGTVAAYASVIDNTTNDPRTLLPR